MSGALAALTFAAPTVANASVNVLGQSPSASNIFRTTEDTGTWSPVPEFERSRFYLGADLHYVHHPLVELNLERTRQKNVLVTNMTALDLVLGVSIYRRWGIYVGAPMLLVQEPGVASQFAIGDTRLFSKVRLTSDNAIVDVAVIPELYIPTGSQDLYTSDGSVGGGVKLAFEKDFGKVWASANIGYRYSPSAVFRNLNYQHRVPLALGLYFPIGKKRLWGIQTEGYGDLTLPFNRYNNPGEFYAGVRYQASKDVALNFGGAVGAVTDIASSNFRIAAGVKLAPGSVRKAKPRVLFTKKEIKIFEEVQFLHNSAILTDRAKTLLDEVADTIKKNRSMIGKVSIEGHTNDLGTDAYNLKLSDARAKSVRAYLSTRGIIPNLLLTKGYGESMPKADARDLPLAVQRELNRRVEFKVLQ